jgi:phosphatidylglycerophosphate synthase
MDKEDQAKRIINTFTGPCEKRLLITMAARMPRWVSSDHMTILGLISAFIIATGYILTWHNTWWLLLTNFGLLLNWFGDSLDGTLARVRHTEREVYGYFVDHICDVWTTLLLCIGLGLSPLMHIEIGLFLAIGYLMLNIYTHINAYTRKTFRLSFGKFGPTEVRIIVATLNFILIGWNPVLITIRQTPFSLVDIAGIIMTTIFFLIFIYDSFKDAIALDKIDRAKRLQK